VLQEYGGTQAAMEWTWLSREPLLLLALCTCRLGVLSVAFSHLAYEAATKVVFENDTPLL